MNTCYICYLLATCIALILYVVISTIGGKDDISLLNKCNFVMIKYPRKGRSIPHERVFTMDLENLVCTDRLV